MKPQRHIILLLLVGLLSCVGIKSDFKTTHYPGNFQEHSYDFFESITNSTISEELYKLPFDIKFGGIQPNPSNGKKEYTWLRSPDNLVIAFNTAKSVGLDKFVSLEDYNKINTDWCCNTQWEKKSLHIIVQEFLHSDTSSVGNDYYSQFWQRRRKERNLTETYNILKQINEFYKSPTKDTLAAPTNTVLQGLWEFDLKLLHSDSNTYNQTALAYFNYLKKVNLEHSAYKLIFHNTRLKLSDEYKDSLLHTLKFKIVSPEEWERMNDNEDGWLTSENYPDPNRYGGP